MMIESWPSFIWGFAAAVASVFALMVTIKDNRALNEQIEVDELQRKIRLEKLRYELSLCEGANESIKKG